MGGRATELVARRTNCCANDDVTLRGAAARKPSQLNFVSSHGVADACDMNSAASRRSSCCCCCCCYERHDIFTANDLEHGYF